MQRPSPNKRGTLPRMPGTCRIRAPTAPELPVSGKQDNMREVSYPLLQAAHARKDPRCYAVFRAPHGPASSPAGSWTYDRRAEKRTRLEEEMRSCSFNAYQKYLKRQRDKLLKSVSFSGHFALEVPVCIHPLPSQCCLPPVTCSAAETVSFKAYSSRPVIA